MTKNLSPRAACYLFFFGVLAMCRSTYAGDADTMAVVASIKPLHSLVQGVLGDTATAGLVNSASPHETAFRPSQMNLLRQAGIIFYISDELEPGMARAVSNLPPATKVKAVMQTEGLTLLQKRQIGGDEAHEHGHGHGHAHDGEHGEPDSLYRIDPHIWLDIGNAEKIVDSLVHELSATFPGNRAAYRANADRMIQRLHRSDKQIRNRLAGILDKPFIVFHDAYHYFEDRYGLTNAGALTWNPHIPPSAKRLNAISAEIRDSGALCAFHEPQFPGKLIDLIAQDGQVRKGMLDPIGQNIPAGPDLYFRLLDELARSLTQCLGGDER